RTPMWFASINLVVNAVGSAVLFFLFQRLGWMPHVGIAIATTMAGWINAGLLMLALMRSGDYRADRRLIRNTWLILLASVVMGLAIAGILPVMNPYFAREAGRIVRGASLAGLVAAGISSYAMMIVATGVLRIDQLRRFMRRAA